MFAKCLFIFALVTVLVSSASSSKCCREGQILLKNSSSTKWVCMDQHNGNNRTYSVNLHCPKGVEWLDSKRAEQPYYIDTDRDELVFDMPNRIVSYNSENYCAYDGEYGETDESMVLVCDPTSETEIPSLVTSMCMLVSVGGLILTAIVYAKNSKTRDVSIVNLCFSQAMALTLLFAMREVSYSDMTLCAARGFFAYFFLLVSIFWTTVISFEVLHSALGRPKQKSNFMMNLAFAWGIPTMLTVITAIVNFMPGSHLKPGIGLNHCWFFDNSQEWLYLYSVMLMLNVINIVVFVTVTVITWSRPIHSSHDFAQRFTTCLRLFAVMGITWIFEMISSLVDSSLTWEVIDIFTSLVGLWIFLALVKLSPHTPDVAAPTTDKTQYISNITETPPKYVKFENEKGDLDVY